ncbi:acyltransferase family protein [Listeria booriae]|uniref:Acyltransferase family protein n=1 Tax=Listeria booriae TaxID=1552123 RepID=A0A7X1CCU3_9LIST|nr:acyltransferase family protein [Listeria booriae]MBC1492827.1 acyltransferase family protein [Listeria booriae]MBC1504094.1 acyltransferase family protein [Listeria booriae]MBC1513848.1 acyltransferase family protein [Listeria booriae]MBC1524309.1 acyltransferase family protein [Listeria booriae]MBC6135263.1 acyltransferase family protein [Listeria booriae]
MNQRLVWIDNLKAYGMILVIIGHSFVLSSAYEYSEMLMKLIYSFHMPLFFFISGYLFRNKNNKGNIFRRKWKTLILPYFIFQIITVVIINSFYYLTTGHLERDPLSTLLSVFYLNGSVGWNSPLWFLMVLAIIDVLYYFFNKLDGNTGIQITLVLLSSIIGWLLSETGIQYPFGLQIVFVCFLFYYLGNITKKYAMLKLLSKNLFFYVFVVVTSGFFLIASMLWLNGTKHTSLYDNYLGTSYILFILTALSGILFSFLVFQMLYTNTVFTIFGEESILLLGTQYFFLLGIDEVSRAVGIYSPLPYYLVIKVLTTLIAYKIILYLWLRVKKKPVTTNKG